MLPHALSSLCTMKLSTSEPVAFSVIDTMYLEDASSIIFSYLEDKCKGLTYKSNILIIGSASIILALFSPLSPVQKNYSIRSQSNSTKGKAFDLPVANPCLISDIP